MAVSVEDIGRLAGVARATAYRVLTNSPRVSEEARRKVMGAVRELGYPRLRPRGKRRPGYVVWGPLPNGVEPGAFFYEMLGAIEKAVARRRRAVLSVSAPLGDDPGELPLDMLQHEIEGVITLHFYSNMHLRALAARWPLACMFSARDVPGAISLAPDFAAAAMNATQLLLEAGHRRIALVTGKPQGRNFSRLFTEGYAGALTSAGIGADPRLIHAASENLGRIKPSKTYPLGITAGRELLGRRDRPSAIVARHDSVEGVLAAAAELKLRVPRDLSVVGFGTRKSAQQYSPAVTSFCFSPDAAVALALKMMKAVPEEGVRVAMPVELFEGKSVRAVRG
ncbi:MAG: LacI family DNA-binding transcriptional regulator [Planctomycetota bacterium]|jgi:LacI family transcriptional regulator